MIRNQSSRNFTEYIRGIRHGIPIALGYFAVALALGINARKAGITPGQATLMSLLINASAGEAAAINMILQSASYIEAAIMEAVANARYLLMSCALSQKLSPEMKYRHRFFIGFLVTDEFFALGTSTEGKLNPFYYYGAVTVATPSWALGTFIGAILGDVLPVRAVSALGVGLYGMFLAIFIPPARKSKVIAVLVILSFLASGAASVLPWVSSLPEGTRTIILTVLLSAGAALFFPVKHEEKQKEGVPDAR